MQFDLIVAFDNTYGISKQGQIPWEGTPEAYESTQVFNSRVREGTAIIMGKTTYDKVLGCEPLTGPINIVISSANAGITIEGALTDSPVIHVGSLIAALNYCGQIKPRRCFVVGGAATYAEALKSPFLRYVYVNKINTTYTCDTYFPFHILEAGLPMKMEKGQLNKYYKIDCTNNDELAFHRLCVRLLLAPLRPNRTLFSARGLFHEVLKFNLTCPYRGSILPLITSKRTLINSVLGELLWFISAGTSTKQLHENNVHIWDGNSSREYLDSRGLDYAPGELGPIYGWQWRHYGEAWPHDKPQGVDQLAQVIEIIKTDPFNRRLLVSAWNVTDLNKMALPPCHYSFQFHVEQKDGRNVLNCLVNMRSADIALGVPFNIASYALLTHMVAYITKLTPGVLSLSMADCHLYENHVDGVNTMLKRFPRRFPTIRFSDRLLGKKLTIDDFRSDDVIIGDYQPHPHIKLEMAV